MAEPTRLFVNEDGGMVRIFYESHDLSLSVSRRGYARAWIAFETVCSAFLPSSVVRWIHSCRVCDRPGKRLVGSTFRAEDWSNG